MTRKLGPLSSSVATTLINSVVTVLLFSTLLGAAPKPKPTPPNPVLPTPKFIPKTESPRFFVAGDPLALLVWALRTPPGKSTFTYYWISTPSGELKQQQYDLQMLQPAGGDHVSLTLSRDGHKCRTYRARFEDDEQVLRIYTTNIADEPPQSFDVMDNGELFWAVRGLQDDAAMDATWYHDMRKHHYKPGGRSISARDPRFTPPC